jgi:hypothetical protein
MAALRTVNPIENISDAHPEASSFDPISSLAISSGARYVLSLSNAFEKLVLSLGQLSWQVTLKSPCAFRNTL